MQALYHYPLCPFSRQARIIVKELDSSLSLVKEEFWLRRPEFLKLNPSGDVPVIIELSGAVICGIYPIIEYLNAKNSSNHLMDGELERMSEIRRLVFWFNDKFYREVTKWILDEKLIRALSRTGSPRAEYIRAAKTNLHHHMCYIARLLAERAWLASDEKMTFADIACASHLSVIDYLGEINWDNYVEVKDWYSLIKSRPSFAPLLQDFVAGFFPPKYYADLDF